MARVLLLVLSVVAAAWLAVCSGSPSLEARLDRVVQAYIDTTIKYVEKFSYSLRSSPTL